MVGEITFFRSEEFAAIHTQGSSGPHKSIKGIKVVDIGQEIRITFDYEELIADLVRHLVISLEQASHVATEAVTRLEQTGDPEWT